MVLVVVSVVGFSIVRMELPPPQLLHLNTFVPGYVNREKIYTGVGTNKMSANESPLLSNGHHWWLIQ